MIACVQSYERGKNKVWKELDLNSKEKHKEKKTRKGQSVGLNLRLECTLI